MDVSELLFNDCQMECLFLWVVVVLCCCLMVSCWQLFQWWLEVVVFDLGEYGIVLCCLDYVDDEKGDECWFMFGFFVMLFCDEVEGYYLNVIFVVFCWFVLWCLGELGMIDVGWVILYMVLLSYNEVGCWFDGGEMVENVLLDVVVLEWLQVYVVENYWFELKKWCWLELFLLLEDCVKF